MYWCILVIDRQGEIQMEKFYTIEEIAEISRLHLNTVYRHLRQGKLKAHKVGNQWRVTQEALDKYLKGE